jgi:LysM repeat protein
MKTIRLIALAATTAAIAACASGNYDTPADPYAMPGAGATVDNPVYDSPAAYEDGAAPADGTVPADGVAALPAIPDAAAPTANTAPANGAAIIHTVVKGDTLSGIAAKYKVPMASIRTANRMTNDTVVLGRKMVIPPQ